MTDEGKKAHFGEPGYSPDETIQYLTVDEVLKFSQHDPELARYVQFLNDKKLNDKIDSILPPYKRKQNYPDFKKRLFYFLSQIKFSVEWRNKIYAPLNSQKFKRDINRINKSLAKISFHKFFKQQYTAAIVEQLKKQNPGIDSMEAFDTATAIVDYSENLMPLMQKAAGNAWEYAEQYGEDRDKIDMQEATIKEEVAHVLAFLLKNYLDAPVQNSGKASISKFDNLFIACCEVIGFKDVSPKSDHVQEAVNKKEAPLPKHLQRFAATPQKTRKSETG